MYRSTPVSVYFVLP